MKINNLKKQKRLNGIHTGCPNKHGNSVTNSICFDCIRLYLVKQENCRIQTEETCPSLLLILRRHYSYIFTVFYPFYEINSRRHNNIMAFKIRYYNANS